MSWGGEKFLWLPTQGKEAPLREEIQDEEPVMNGNVELRLPFDPVTLVAREAGVLDDSQ